MKVVIVNGKGFIGFMLRHMFGCRKRHNTKLHITKRLTAGNSEPFAYYVMIEFRKA
jgi:hypothetical protein